MSNASQAYLQANVNTAGQGELLLMLYDGAIKFLQQARVKMLEKDYAKKGILISKAIDIINELASSLNMEKGGSISENLNNLYFFCTTHLLQANLRMDPTKIDSVINILSGLRGAYAEIIETPEARRASQQIAARMAPSINASNRQTFSTQSANVGVAGQSHGRSVYGQQAQKSNQPQANVNQANVNQANVNQGNITLSAQIENSTPALGLSPSVVNMNEAKPALESPIEQINNVDTYTNKQVQTSSEQNNMQAVKVADASASMPSTERQSGISALKRPLSGLSAKNNSRRMSLYGKVGQ